MDDAHEAVTRTERTTNGRRAKPALAAIAVAVVGALVLSGCWSANQSKLMNLVNDYRKSNGRRALSANAQAMSKAQKWSDHMAATGVLEHSGGGSTIDTSGLPKFCALAENVSKAPTIDAAHAQFVRSSVHRTNMLGNYTHIGTGVTRKGNVVWVTEIFFRSC